VKPTEIAITATKGQNLPDSIATENIDLSTIKESTALTRDLILPSGIMLPENSSREVSISIKVREK